jgi:hypothetical protein
LERESEQSFERGGSFWRGEKLTQVDRDRSFKEGLSLPFLHVDSATFDLGKV